MTIKKYSLVTFVFANLNYIFKTINYFLRLLIKF